MQYIKYLVSIVVLSILGGCADFRAARIAVEEKQYIDARDQYQSLNQKGFTEASYELAKLYSAGVLGEQEKRKAIALYEAALEQGDQRAVYPLAKALQQYSDLPEDKRRSAQLMSQASDLGMSKADLPLAKLLISGQWIPQDIPRAVALLTAHAEQNPTAAKYLGDLHLEDVYLPKNIDLSGKFYAKAYSLGDDKSGLKLVEVLQLKADVESLAEAEMLLREMTDKGNKLANYLLLGFLEKHHPDNIQEIALRTELSVSSGFTQSRLRLADFYFRGEGVDVDTEKAIAIYEELASEGNGSATARLGDIYRDGKVRPVDYARSMQMYRLSLEQGFERAELRIAGLLENGFGVPRDKDAALLIYNRFAQEGDAAAAFKVSKLLMTDNDSAEYPQAAWQMLNLSANARYLPAKLTQAELYTTEGGQFEDFDAGISLLNELVELKSGKAHYLLAGLCQRGRLNCSLKNILEHLLTAHEAGVVAASLSAVDLLTSNDQTVKDLVLAQSILEGLVSQNHPEAIFRLARIIETRAGQGAVTPEVVQMYARAAALGYPPAVLRYADLTLDGIGVEQSVDSAIATYNRLSEAEVGAATFRLGKLYEFGVYREQNDVLALSLYELSLKQGYDFSHLKLGEFKLRGRGTEVSYEQGLQHLIFLAKQKQPKAAYALGRAYAELRNDLTRDWFDNALHWYSEAIALNFPQANFELAALIDEITQTQHDIDVAKRADSELRESSAISGTVPIPGDNAMSLDIVTVSTETPTSPPHNAYSTRLYLEAALKGHAGSMLQTGKRMFNGWHLPKNRVQGLAWVIAAARMNTRGATAELMAMVDEFSSQAEINTAWRMSENYLRANIRLPTQITEKQDDQIQAEMINNITTTGA